MSAVLMGETAGTCTNVSAVFNMVTSCLGAGIMNVPYGVASAGWAVSAVLLVTCCIFSLHASKLMGRIMIMARRAAGTEPVTGIEDVAGIAVGNKFKTMVGFLNCADLILSCTIMLCTMASTLDTSAHDHFGYEKYSCYHSLVIAVTLFVMPLCWLKSMQHLAKAAILGVVANLVLLGCIIVDAFYCVNMTDAELIEAGSRSIVTATRPAFGNDISGAFGIFAFTFAVSIVIPSLQNDMKEPESLPAVATISHVIVLLIYITIGSVSFFAYGDAPKGVVTEVMVTSFCRSLVSLCVACSLFSSVPLFLSPCGVMLEEWAIPRFPNLNEMCIRIVGRSCLLFIAAAGALTTHKVELFQAFVGAVTTTLICLLFPNFFFWRLREKLGVDLDISLASPSFLVLMILCSAFAVVVMVNGFIVDGSNLWVEIQRNM